MDNYLFPKPKGSRRASFNPSMFGDLFADYGWITLAAFSVLIGIAMRILWEYFQRQPRSVGLQIVFAGTLPMLVIMIRNNVTDAVGRSLYQIGPLILCLIVCSRPRVRRVAGHAVGRARGGTDAADSVAR